MSLRVFIDEPHVTKNYLNYEDPYYIINKDLIKINFLNKNNIHNNYLGYKLQILKK